MGTILITVIALALCAYVAIPLLFPNQADPLPDPRDPVEQDLKDEADALLRAIDELEDRTDLAQARRDELKARYEAKAAGVLRALDKRRETLAGRPAAAPAKPPGRVPVAALILLGLMVLTGSALGGFVLPRITEGTVTIFGSEFEAARAFRDLQQAAEREPTAENLMSLADAYWHQQDMEEAKATYSRVVNEVSPVPPLAYQRLAQLTLQEDPGQALGYLERAREGDPDDLDTLFMLGEIYYAMNELGRAIGAWEDFLAAPGGAEIEVVETRLQAARELQPLAEDARDDPSEENLLAYAGALWEREEQERAAGVYLGVLADHDPEHPVAMSRVGQMLFFSGLTADAVVILERAREVGGYDLDTLLFLGNAHFSLEQYEAAIDVWEQYVTEAGGAEQAGRVPELIENARARLAGEPAEPIAPMIGGGPMTGAASGAALYQTHCAACHGGDGQGGAGPRLAGNAQLTNSDYVASTILNGRGMMPGFRGRLSEGEVDALVGFLGHSFASSGAIPAR